MNNGPYQLFIADIQFADETIRIGGWTNSKLLCFFVSHFLRP